jgi:hypothetical protein
MRQVAAERELAGFPGMRRLITFRDKVAKSGARNLASFWLSVNLVEPLPSF